MVPFSSGFRFLAHKSSLKSHQMTPFFIQNENWEQNDVILVKNLSFWTKQLSFDDFLMMTWEQENQRQRKFNQTQSNLIFSAFILHGHAMISWDVCLIRLCFLKSWRCQSKTSEVSLPYSRPFACSQKQYQLVMTKKKLLYLLLAYICAEPKDYISNSF